MAAEAQGRRVTRYVLDSSAAIALVLSEPGAREVEKALPDCTISAVNLSEIVSGLVNNGFPGAVARDSVARLDLSVVPFDEDMALDAGALREATRSRGLSLGDRACLSLARRLGLPALTADRVWLGLDLGIEIRLIRD